MKYAFNLCTLAAAATLASSLPALADEASHKTVCIRSYEIDHTEIPNDSTIVFHMRNHKVFVNSLVARCVGLKNNTHGFTYSPTDPGTDEICSNLFTIRVNDTGQVCLPGVFTAVEPPAAN
jgi:hypothetical protein